GGDPGASMFFGIGGQESTPDIPIIVLYSGGASPRGAMYYWGQGGLVPAKSDRLPGGQIDRRAALPTPGSGGLWVRASRRTPLAVRELLAEVPCEASASPVCLVRTLQLVWKHGFATNFV